MLTSWRTRSIRVSSISILTMILPPPSSSGQQLILIGAASSLPVDQRKIPTPRPTGNPLPPLRDKIPCFSYPFLSTFGCVAKLKVDGSCALLTAMTAAAPASVLAVRFKIPLTSQDSTAPSRFIDTVIFSSNERVRGVDGAAAGGGTGFPKPKSAPPFEAPPNKLSSAAMAEISESFFAPPNPPSFIPDFAKTLGATAVVALGCCSAAYGLYSSSTACC
mmetsp:Transcript_7353/g.18451  ORF Transcript_7353/g.18451 Transcript_7353/m.18451 type:complete len:219 (+) Transcript_7353:434-1090(+)